MPVMLSVNGETRTVEVPVETPLLWVLRDNLRLLGTKFGCGVGACGACTVHVDGVAARSCVLPVGYLAGARITTIEALSVNGDHPVQRAWVAHQVPQCGYCQSGMVMAAAAMLAANPSPSDADIAATMTNLCRCGTHHRIRAALRSISAGGAK